MQINPAMEDFTETQPYKQLYVEEKAAEHWPA